jgi:hypothetical protein
MFYVLFMCKCVLPPGVNPIAVDKYININELLPPGGYPIAVNKYIIIYHIIWKRNSSNGCWVKGASKKCLFSSVSIYVVSQVAITCHMCRVLMLTKPEDTRPRGWQFYMRGSWRNRWVTTDLAQDTTQWLAAVCTLMKLHIVLGERNLLTSPATISVIKATALFSNNSVSHCDIDRLDLK